MVDGGGSGGTETLSPARCFYEEGCTRGCEAQQRSCYVTRLQGSCAQHCPASSAPWKGRPGHLGDLRQMKWASQEVPPAHRGRGDTNACKSPGMKQLLGKPAGRVRCVKKSSTMTNSWSDSRDPYGRELAPESCPLTSTHTPWYMSTRGHVHTQHVVHVIIFRKPECLYFQDFARRGRRQWIQGHLAT